MPQKQHPAIVQMMAGHLRDRGLINAHRDERDASLLAAGYSEEEIETHLPSALRVASLADGVPRGALDGRAD